jgi:hypothetical protein
MKPQGHHGLQTNGRNMKSLNTTLSALALKSALTATVLALLVAASPLKAPGVIPTRASFHPAARIAAKVMASGEHSGGKPSSPFQSWMAITRYLAEEPLKEKKK